ncbi:glycosyltransferase [Conexibacter woesei]|uniref:glycosyltransferase n=1 Tax=Conexibacter woesei TaxID=191495 RepID=UPI000479BA23|nr:glycosyltransferase [Conexibacter woesei]
MLTATFALLPALAAALVVLAGAWTLLGLIVSAAAVVNARWLRRPSHLAGGAGPRRFLAIIATTGEPTLSAAVEALLAARVPAGCRLRICVVGADVPTPRSRRVTAIRTPAAINTKPARFNLAMAQTGLATGTADYIIMVDSDTQVEAGMLEAVVAAAGPDRAVWPDVLQPLVVSAAPPGSAWPVRADALLHTRWRLGFELTLLRLGYRRGSVERRRWAPLSYAVGCCVAIRADVAAAGFEEPSEDITLGYDLSRAGRAIAPVRSVATTDTKPGVGETARRNRVWWSGSITALRRPAAAEGRAVRVLRGLELARLAAWVPGPALFGAALGLPFAAVPSDTALAFALALVLTAGAGYVIAGVAVLAAGPRFTSERWRTAPRVLAWCVARWWWTCAVPCGVILRDATAVATVGTFASALARGTSRGVVATATLRAQPLAVLSKWRSDGG